MFGGAAGMPIVQSIERLDLKPDDVLVIKCAGRITQENAEAIKAQMEKIFPGRKTLVLDSDLDLKVLRNA
jgi:anti-anti-sigma regulatory factor